jgi:peptidoglycan/LPS O-acetylase OafA/YrhL
MYIVLSGFITHLAYGSKSFNTVGESCKFYLCRFGRIWLTFYFSLALGFLSIWLRNDVGPVEDYVLTLSLLEAWFPVLRHKLAEQHLPLPTAGWTLSTLTLPWVLYPALNAAFRRVPARIAPTVGLMLLFSVTEKPLHSSCS